MTPVSPYKRTNSDISGSKEMPASSMTDQSDNADRRSEEYGCVVASQSSTSSPDDQMTLLPVPPEQFGSQYSRVSDRRAYHKTVNFVFGLIFVFKDSWTQFTKVFRLQAQLQSKGTRRVKVDLNRTKPLVDERTRKEYVGNRIRSNKYTPWTFIPRQLFAQFSKLANFYFLCFAVMQLIPGLSTTGSY